MVDIKWAGATELPNPYVSQIEKVVKRDIDKSVYQQNLDKKSVAKMSEKSLGDIAKDKNIKRLTKKVEIKTYRYSLEFNDKLKRYVLKAIDNETDKIIRQSPSIGQIKYLEENPNIINLLA